MGYAFAMPTMLLLAPRAHLYAGAIQFFLLLATTSLLAAIGLRLRVVNDAGAAAGFVCVTLVSLALGWRALLMVLLLAMLAAAATRFHDSQRPAGSARHAIRSSGEILANLAPATLCLLPALFTRYAHAALCAAFLAALAESAADTVASELGESLGGEPYMITTLRPAPIGADGAVSSLGTLFAAAAAALLVTIALWLGLVGALGAAIAFAAAIFGLFFDSLLGATAETAGRIGNNTVNFVSSTFAAIAALGLWSILSILRCFLRGAQ